MHPFEALNPVHLCGVPSNAMVDLSGLGLSREHAARRKKSIGGYDARIIASGDTDEIDKLIDVKRSVIDDDDLAQVLMVQMGNWTEALNLAWFSRETGLEVRGRGQLIPHADVPWAHTSLDGACMRLDGRPALVECKCTPGFMPLKEVWIKYWPQVQHSLWVLDWDYAFLSVFMGTHRYLCQPIERDPLFMDALYAEEERFWDAVLTGKKFTPEKLPPVPLDPSKMVETDMTVIGPVVDEARRDAWAAAAPEWKRLAAAVKQFDQVKETIRQLIPVGTKKAIGSGIEATIAKNGRMTIKEHDAETEDPEPGSNQPLLEAPTVRATA